MEKQQKFVEALAAVVAVKADNINITDIKDVAAGRRRRLQQAGVDVAYNVSGTTRFAASAGLVWSMAMPSASVSSWAFPGVLEHAMQRVVRDLSDHPGLSRVTLAAVFFLAPCMADAP